MAISTNHWAIFLSNNANKNILIQELLDKKAKQPFHSFNQQKGILFSDLLVNEMMAEEAKRDYFTIAKNNNRSLQTLSAGEKKKALLVYCISQQPDYIILDNPFDNLDIASQQNLRLQLSDIALHTTLIQLIHRATDVLPFISNAASVNDTNNIVLDANVKAYLHQLQRNHSNSFNANIPLPIRTYQLSSTTLVAFNNVSVAYENKKIVTNINWQINVGEFWQLKGPNGSGKTTLLSLITGDNPKGYGQDLILFGRKKGTGETVWEIKDKLGYFTSSMTDLFNGYFTLEQMIISGFFDSIGLYKKPTEVQIKLADEWLAFINLLHLKNKIFNQLSLGQQRMVMIVRAMLKHPPLLILDEPTAGLDDANILLVTSLINKIVNKSTTAILYVSHRIEAGLLPHKIFELTPTENGSIGKVL